MVGLVLDRNTAADVGVQHQPWRLTLDREIRPMAIPFSKQIPLEGPSTLHQDHGTGSKAPGRVLNTHVIPQVAAAIHHHEVELPTFHPCLLGGGENPIQTLESRQIVR